MAEIEEEEEEEGEEGDLEEIEEEEVDSEEEIIMEGSLDFRERSLTFN